MARGRLGVAAAAARRAAALLALARRCAVSPGAMRVRTLFEDVPFERAADWPVVVELGRGRGLRALARRRGCLTEAEWHRAAEGGGDAAARATSAFRHGSPLPVGSHPEGASASGRPRARRQRLGVDRARRSRRSRASRRCARYPGYSADFFDGAHFVLLGGSWATDEALLRPSFRNWFQPHYPYVFSKFRCARSR